MIHIFRKHQRWLLIIIAILTIVAFGWLYNNTNPRELGTSEVARIYGKTLHSVDIQRELKLEEIAMELGLQSYVANLACTAQSEDAITSEFIWNSIVMRHEAEQLWLSPTAQQIVELLKSLPIFQTNGQFDRAKYEEFLKNRLAPQGITERHLESLLADVWRFDELVKIIISPVAVGDKEVAVAMRGFADVDLFVVRSSPDTTLNIGPISDTEVEEYFKVNQARYRAPEYRSVELVRFDLPKDASKLNGKAKMEAMQKLADQVVAFSEKVTKNVSNFDQEAKSVGIKVESIGPFDRFGNAQNPGQASVLPGLASATFALTEGQPVSDIIQDGDRFIVARLTSVEPSRSMNLEEVKMQIREALRMQKTLLAQQEKLASLTDQFFSGLSEGISPAKVATKLGLKTQEIKKVRPFSEGETKEIMLARLTFGLEEGEWFVPTPQGGEQVFVMLQKRYPLEKSIESERADKVREMLLDGQRKLLFFEWLRVARAEAKLEVFASRQ